MGERASALGCSPSATPSSPSSAFPPTFHHPLPFSLLPLDATPLFKRTIICLYPFCYLLALPLFLLLLSSSRSPPDLRGDLSGTLAHPLSTLCAPCAPPFIMYKPDTLPLTALFVVMVWLCVHLLALCFPPLASSSSALKRPFVAGAECASESCAFPPSIRPFCTRKVYACPNPSTLRGAAAAAAVATS